MQIKELFKAAELFKPQNSSKVLEITPYVISKSILREHCELLLSTESNTIDYAREKINCDDVEKYALNIGQDENSILLAIKSDNKLVGTSKISIQIRDNKQCVVSGILLHEELRTGLNIERSIKGMASLRASTQLSIPLIFGACNKRNIRSVAYFKYFGYSMNNRNAGESELEHICFFLKQNDLVNHYLKRLHHKLRSYGMNLLETSNFQESLLELNISDILGFSSLSYFNLLSEILECKPNASLDEIYEINTVREIIDYIGYSFESFVSE